MRRNRGLLRNVRKTFCPLPSGLAGSGGKVRSAAMRRVEICSAPMRGGSSRIMPPEQATAAVFDSSVVREADSCD